MNYFLVETLSYRNSTRSTEIGLLAKRNKDFFTHILAAFDRDLESSEELQQKD